MPKLSEMRSGRLTPKIEDDTEDEELKELRKLARDNNVLNDVWETTKGKGVNLLKGLGRVLNVGAAASAGAVQGVIDDEKSVVKGVMDGVKSNMSYTDIIRNNHDTFGLPENPADYTRTQKVASGAAGFIGDVVLDPITYLSFGGAAYGKIAGKSLSKVGGGLLKKGIGQNIERSALSDFFEHAVKNEGKIDDAFRGRIKALGGTDEYIDEVASNATRITEEPALRFRAMGGNIDLKVPGTSAGVKKIKDANRLIGEKLPAYKSAQESLGKLFASDPVASSPVRRAIREAAWQTGKKLDEFSGYIDDAFGKKNPFGKFSKAERDEFTEALIEVNAPARKGANAPIKQFQERYQANLDEATARAMKKDLEGGLDKPIRPDALKKSTDQLTDNDKTALIKALKDRNLPTNFKGWDEAQASLRKYYRKHAKDIAADQTKLLSKAASARAKAKAVQKTKTVEDIFQDITDENKRNKFIHAGKVMFEQTPDGKKGMVPRLAALAKIPKEEALKFYFPHRFRDKINQKGTRVGSLMKINDNFQKISKGVVNDQLIRNPIEAYLIATDEVARAAIKTDSVSLMDKLGRSLDEFADEEAARRAGFERVSFKGVDGKRMKAYLPKDVAKELNPWLKGKENPLDDLFRATGFDWATGIFKGWVTGLFPGFHVRNMNSNQFLQFNEAGFSVLSPKNQMQAMKIMSATRKLPKEATPAMRQALKRKQDKLTQTKIKTGLGEEFTLQEIAEEMERRGILGQGPRGVGIDDLLNINKYKDGTIPDKARILNRFNPVSRDFIPMRIGQNVGSAIEDQAKANIFLHQVKKGKSFDEAWEATERALFDYGNLTEFERTVMRRFIPFYTFMRKNLEAQARTMIKAPGRQAAKFKLINAANRSFGTDITEEDYEAMPPWVRQSMGIKLDQRDEFGRPVYVTGLGLPIEQVANMLSGASNPATNAVASIMTQMNPIFKMPAERATGMDFFRQKNIEDINNAGDFVALMDAMPEDAQKDIKDLLRWEEVEKGVYVKGKKVGTETKYTADPMKLHFLRNTFLSRLASETSRAFTENEAVPEPWDSIRSLTGLKANLLDEEGQRYWNELEEKQALIRELDRMGVINQYEKWFEMEDED